MKTEVIMKKGWLLIVNYDFLFTMSKGDVVEWEDIEYRVDCCVLDIKENKMQILVIANKKTKPNERYHHKYINKRIRGFRSVISTLGY